MEICFIETVPIVETQLFYESDFFNSVPKKSVVFFDNFNNFIRKLTVEQKISVFSTLGSPLDLWSFSLISQHPREVKKPYLGASWSMYSEGASSKCKFSEKTQKIRFFFVMACLESNISEILIEWLSFLSYGFYLFVSMYGLRLSAILPQADHYSLVSLFMLGGPSNFVVRKWPFWGIFGLISPSKFHF